MSCLNGKRHETGRAREEFRCFVRYTVAMEDGQ